MTKYNPSKIERKWQRYWESKKFYHTKDSVGGRENQMLLTEFPYPSGNLHIGHWYAFALPDIKARYLRMKGINVLYPIGFDAFGLPAENAAIKHGVSPKDWTKKNIAYMTKQLRSMGATFDWAREVQTIDPEYYKWTQWMFLEFYKAGLAYKAKSLVNWCPKDKTVLANEQVIKRQEIRDKEQVEISVCERCGTEVIQKELFQWMFKITKYVDELIEGLKDLDWQETAKLGQINWVGRSEGAKIKFAVKSAQFTDSGPKTINSKLRADFIEVFTTRPDTLFGATFLVVSPEMAQKWIDSHGDLTPPDVKKYVHDSLKKTQLQRQESREKTGVDTLARAINPVTGREIPIWVADYVLGGYGTGAIMAVPAHDERDHQFAKKFNLPIKAVIEPETGKILPNEQTRKSIVAIVEDESAKKFLTLNWGSKLGGTLFIGGGREEGEDEVQTAIREIKEETGYTNVEFVSKTELMHHHYFAFSKNVARNIEVLGLHFKLKGKEKEQKNLQADEKGNFKIEWLSKDEILSKMEDENHLLSFRRLVMDEIYTGAGIMANSGKYDGKNSEEAGRLIVEELKAKGLGSFQKTYRLHDWILSRQRYWGVPIPVINCPNCGHVPVSEKDLPIKLPPLKDFKPSDDGRSPLAKAERWLKAECPKCGGSAERETDTMDTFVDSSWYFMRYADPENKKIFAEKTKMANWLPVPMYVGGAEHTTMHLLYARFFTKALHTLGHIDFDEPFLGRMNRGIILGPDGQKMSKSRGNVVDPDVEVKNYGADTVRMYLAFMGPYEQGGPWDPKGINGVARFLNRAWNFLGRYSSKAKPNLEVQKILNKYVKEIRDDIETLSFNTGVSGLMKLLNEVESHELSKKEYEIFLKLLAPFAPHIAEELWQNVLKNKKSVHLESWPAYDESLIADEKLRIVIQVNGKVRDMIDVEPYMSEDDIKEAAVKRENVKKHIGTLRINKIIYVKGRVVNIVAG